MTKPNKTLFGTKYFRETVCICRQLFGTSPARFRRSRQPRNLFFLSLNHRTYYSLVQPSSQFYLTSSYLFTYIFYIFFCKIPLGTVHRCRITTLYIRLSAFEFWIRPVRRGFTKIQSGFSSISTSHLNKRISYDFHCSFIRNVYARFEKFSIINK